MSQEGLLSLPFPWGTWELANTGGGLSSDGVNPVGLGPLQEAVSIGEETAKTGGSKA
jgi:hypothetical protein